MDLELYSSEQLISELLRRETFVGIVVRSETEAKGISAHRYFRVDTSPNLRPDQTVAIMDGLVCQMKEAIN